jgi:hypothetical protein
MLCNHKEKGDDDVRTHIVYRNMRRSEDVRSRTKKRRRKRRKWTVTFIYTRSLYIYNTNAIIKERKLIFTFFRTTSNLMIFRIFDLVYHNMKQQICPLYHIDRKKERRKEMFQMLVKSVIFYPVQWSEWEKIV